MALTSLGCKVNYAEMAELAGQLAAAGCDVVRDDQPADVRVLNSCTVTVQADATTRQRLGRLRRQHPPAHLVLTGCSVDGNPDRYLGSAPADPDAGFDAVFANRDKHRIAEYIIELARAGGDGARPGARPVPAPELRARAFIKVQDGCDHRCTYCSVWRARGPSRSRPAAEVLGAARAAAEAGRSEVVLCGVDLGSYGRAWGGSLAELLEQLLEGVPGARYRLSSLNANDIDARLASLNSSSRVCSHWHLPLQSGSDAVLRAMHRGYRRRQFLRVVAALRAADPLTEITTDVMTAFPGETEADHQLSLSLIQEVGFLGCHIFRYSARPQTPAADLPERPDPSTARRRSAELHRVAAACTRAALERGLGRSHQVVWDRVEAGRARGISSTYHLITAVPTPATRCGGLETVWVDRREGDQLIGSAVDLAAGSVAATA